jgi:hypothetical protein
MSIGVVILQTFEFRNETGGGTHFFQKKKCNSSIQDRIHDQILFGDVMHSQPVINFLLNIIFFKVCT